MRTPLAAWRAGVRWPLALIALVAALVVAILVCEAIGWPFLVGPIQHRLEAMLDRRVVLGGDAQRASGVRIGLLGSVRVRAASIEIGAPAWSPTPHTLLARDANLQARLPRPLARLARRAAAHRRTSRRRRSTPRLERRADGRASWQFGKKKEEQADRKEASLPTFGRLAVGDGHVLYVDEVLPAGIDARFALSEGSARRRGVGERARGGSSAARDAASAPSAARGERPQAAASSSAPAARRATRRSPTACAWRPAKAACA